MKVTGPNWPSTMALREALAHVDSPKILKWGSAPMNKLDAMNMLRAKGVASPEVTSDLATARRWVNFGDIVWGRKLMHKEGTDIIKTITDPRWARRDFWVKFIQSTYDFRVHVWDGVAFRMGVKGHADPLNASPVRSDRNGWLLNYNPEVYTNAGTKIQRNLIRQAAVNACAALGILGGAVDVLLGADGNAYVLEVNTAPALGEFTLQAYVEVITKWARNIPVVFKPEIPQANPAPPGMLNGLFGQLEPRVRNDAVPPPGYRERNQNDAPVPPVGQEMLLRAGAAQEQAHQGGLMGGQALQVGVAVHQAIDNPDGPAIIMVYKGVAKTVLPGDPMYRVLVAAVGV